METNSVRTLLWTGVVLLVLLGLAGSLARGYGVVDSFVFTEGPVPEMSRVDRANMRLMGRLVGLEPGSDAYRDVEEQNRRLVGKYNLHPVVTLAHVLPAALLVVLAPLQFSRRIRSRHIRWHRWSGRVIVAVALPVGLSGLYFGLRMPFAGLVEATAIALFGALFLFALVRAFVAIRGGDVVRHRQWMIRMFAVVLGVAMVRVSGILLAFVTRAGPEVWFGASIWIGFGSTVAAAELWIWWTRRPVAPGSASSFWRGVG